jgi:hypothetical protein
MRQPDILLHRRNKPADTVNDRIEPTPAAPYPEGQKEARRVGRA